MRATPSLLAGIEAGGTKWVCAVAVDSAAPRDRGAPGERVAERRIPTRDPATTLAAVAEFFAEITAQRGPIAALGVGTFGPVDLDPRSPGYGALLRTPKAGWSGVDLLGALRRALPLAADAPIDLVTDVAAAAIGEAERGAGQGVRHLAYVTVGTGIGGALLVDGAPLRGRMHPEIGHLPLAAAADGWPGVCPFHRICLEGHASGPAIAARWGDPESLAEDHPAWAREARLLAEAAVALTAAWSPDRLLLGGGVMQRPGLLARVRRAFVELAGGYWPLPAVEDYLQTPALDHRAGIVGALTLAQRRCRRG